MFTLLCTLTGIILAIAALAAYARTRDALHPAIIIAPTFGYMMCVWPLILNADGGLETYFDADQLVHIQLIHFLSVACFAIGLFSVPLRVVQGTTRQIALMSLSGKQRARLYQLALVLGSLAVLSYAYGIQNAGGFVQAYSRVKGGGVAGSGYIGEAVLFSFPSVLALAIARRAGGRRTRASDVVLALLFMSPHLLQGTFGGRRGPLFLALAILLFAWFISKGRRPSLSAVVVGVSLAGLSGLFVFSQRQEVYIGSENKVDFSRMGNVLRPETVDVGDTYITSGAFILAAERNDSFYWGYRYFVTFFIRPIPRQLWPTKYEDMGANWILGLNDQNDSSDLINSVGFSTLAGSASTSVADVYLEFSWGVLPFFGVLGWAFAKAWSLHRTRGGVWTIMFLIMLALSIYLSSQSFSAWAHRLLFIGLPITLLWKHWVVRSSASRPRRRQLIPHPQSPADRPLFFQTPDQR